MNFHLKTLIISISIFWGSCSSTENNSETSLNTQVEITVKNIAQETQADVVVYMFWFFSFEGTPFFAKKSVKTDAHGVANFNITPVEFAIDLSQTETILKFIVFSSESDLPTSQIGRIHLTLKKGETKKERLILKN